ncbi:MAG: diversity-generating retroelement protein Avd [Atribacterota bacterium]|nr:diversity-generating retroelement protein Avd [Atribacterota bacterium]
MASHNDLVIFQKAYDLILWSYPVINQFPKIQRFVLGQQIENTLMGILKNMIRANKERGEERAAIIREISNSIDELFVLFRLAKDLRMVSVRRYGLTAEKINEVAKLLGGWQKKLF